MRNSMRAVLRRAGVALGHAALDVDGAAHGVDDAGELDQQAVAGGLDDAAAVLGDRADRSARARCAFSAGERAVLVGAHQPADSRRRRPRGSLQAGADVRVAE